MCGENLLDLRVELVYLFRENQVYNYVVYMSCWRAQNEL